MDESGAATITGTRNHVTTKKSYQMTQIAIGDHAPEFELPADGGSTISLSALRGSIVVLFFYPKDDTSGCTTEALDFTAHKTEFDAIGAHLIGISPDSVKRHDKFKAKHGLKVTLAADEEKAVLHAYGVWVEKSMYGRKYMGVERTTLLLDAKGRIVRVWNKGKVAGHASEVLHAARELG